MFSEVQVAFRVLSVGEPAKLDLTHGGVLSVKCFLSYGADMDGQGKLAMHNLLVGIQPCGNTPGGVK